MIADRQPLDLDDGVDGGAQLAVIVPLLGSLVADVRSGDLGRSTPCASWTTRDLLNHVVGGASMFAEAFSGGPISDISGRMPDVIGGDPFVAFEAAAGRFGAAAEGPGAMEQVFDLPYGPMTGKTFLRFAAFDLLVHGWDLATTLGRDVDVPGELTEEVDTFARHVLEPWTRDGINFTDQTPPAVGASPLQRLIAYTGRTP
ncbi:TIGR03086 family metal-binding protein [soil metagenome]